MSRPTASTSHAISPFISGVARRATCAVLAAAAALALVAVPSEARAEGPVTPTAKGIVGGALLGAEVVDLTMGIVGVRKGWPYFVFGAVGAAGGGVGGYFVEQNAAPEASVYMLAGGMALVIPTLVVALNATAYQPPDSDSAEPQAPAGGSASRSKRAVAMHVPTSVVDFYDHRLSLGVPALELRTAYTQREIAMFGVEQHPEVSVPVFKASF